MPENKGGWAKELSVYEEMARVFELLHSEIARANNTNLVEGYWDIIADWYDSMQEFWHSHKHKYLTIE